MCVHDWVARHARLGPRNGRRGLGSHKSSHRSWLLNLILFLLFDISGVATGTDSELKAIGREGSSAGASPVDPNVIRLWHECNCTAHKCDRRGRRGLRALVTTLMTADMARAVQGIAYGRWCDTGMAYGRGREMCNA